MPPMDDGYMSRLVKLVPAEAIGPFPFLMDYARPMSVRLGLEIVVALLLVAWAGWAILAEKPLLEDHFESNWGDPRIWSTPRRSVFFENERVIDAVAVGP